MMTMRGFSDVAPPEATLVASLPPLLIFSSHIPGCLSEVDTRKQPFITYAAWMVSSTQRFRDNLSRVFATARRGADGGDGGRLAVSTAHEMNSSLSSRANAAASSAAS